MKTITVKRCWGLNKHNPNGCPFAHFISYKSRFRCEITGKYMWQQSQTDPKIEKDAYGFPVWCPL
jgi:hypothetical protein